MLRVMEQSLGGLLMLLVLADVFLTVLYARAGTGIISEKLARMVWAIFRNAPAKRHLPTVLSFCGPSILVLLVLTWSLLLDLGAGMIVHPLLGTGIRSSSGSSPTDFVTAVYVGGSSLSIVSSSDLEPQTSSTKVFFILNAVIGTSVISLTLTYLMQVYAALRERNALGLKLETMSSQTGDSSELVARLFPRDQLSSGYNILTEIAGEIATTKEAHHFYPVLFYFRFHDALYSVSRITFLALDAVSLIRSSLADDSAAWLKGSAAVQQLWCVSLMLLSTLDHCFLHAEPEPAEAAAARHCDLWVARYRLARKRLMDAGLSVLADEAAGAALYVELRSQWEPLVAALAPTLAYTLDEIDPISSELAKRMSVQL
ncbi:MAG: two pore domain potassium channel family protein [Xanthobacteraceae bacterium]